MARVAIARHDALMAGNRWCAVVVLLRFLFAILPLSVTSEEVRSRSHEICHIAAHHRIHAAVFSHILRPDLLSHRSALTPGELTGLTPRPITRHTHPCGHQRSSERKCRTRKVIRPTRVAARQSRSLQAPCQNPPPPPTPSSHSHLPSALPPRGVRNAPLRRGSMQYARCGRLSGGSDQSAIRRPSPGCCRRMATGLPYSSPVPPSSAALFFARALQG